MKFEVVAVGQFEQAVEVHQSRFVKLERHCWLTNPLHVQWGLRRSGSPWYPMPKWWF